MNSVRKTDIDEEKAEQQMLGLSDEQLSDNDVSSTQQVANDGCEGSEGGDGSVSSSSPTSKASQFVYNVEVDSGSEEDFSDMESSSSSSEESVCNEDELQSMIDVIEDQTISESGSSSKWPGEYQENMEVETKTEGNGNNSGNGELNWYNLNGKETDLGEAHIIEYWSVGKRGHPKMLLKRFSPMARSNKLDDGFESDKSLNKIKSDKLK